MCLARANCSYILSIAGEQNNPYAEILAMNGKENFNGHCTYCFLRVKFMRKINFRSHVVCTKDQHQSYLS